MRIAFISDTHCQHPILPDADLLVHCGDLTGSGSLMAFEQEIKWLELHRNRYPLGILYVPGNHDRGLDNNYMQRAWDYWAQDPYHRYPPPKKDRDPLIYPTVTAMLKAARIQILIDEAIEIEGVKFYGTPMTPRFMNWAFMAEENSLAEFWKKIPNDTQVLISHGPAQGLRDFCPGGHVGSSSLRWYLDNKLPDLKVHSFGHIHEGAGFEYVRRPHGEYLCLNAAVLDGDYKGFNKIHIVDTSVWAIRE